MTKIRPLFDRVIVEKLDAERTTAGGVILPESSDDSRSVWRARVIATGRGSLRDLDTANDLLENLGLSPLEHAQAVSEHAMPVDPGDIVLIGKYTGQICGDKQIVVQVGEILAVEESAS